MARPHLGFPSTTLIADPRTGEIKEPFAKLLDQLVKRTNEQAAMIVALEARLSKIGG